MVNFQNKDIKELLEFGIINIDKSSGPTSFNISDFVRKKLNLRKTSHFGTLDPKVTGVLPIALNRACKLTGYFLGEDKEYIGVMRIHEDISLDKIKKTIKEKFLGKIKQTPPVRSRVKRQERIREIKKFNILEKNGKNILFHVECEGGTYIRKICSDLGDYMKIGTHMLELRRIRAGIIREHDKKYPSINLYEFLQAVDEYKKGNEELLKRMIIPAEIITQLHPIIKVKEREVKRLLTGKPIFKEDLTRKEKMETGKIICVFSEERFIGMYKVTNNGDIFAKSEFVMQPIK
ncbi:RNA-guided pseudouridylation complex pseudouridine synthase subunit Cbf5 [Candidatus Pacearchaeota archaeon]|jgi:H/ACA ribonucleoprotein complex subunit 4|nr:RNA-guided pseudouridylation complex pseudouridine synthase subunit Cbf5 [Candidatus Pacearchaeota archaeon]|tara:strand:+ start:8985 stop:9857 length:873 start_codon:yes stop_codon:yes gene_type:complete